MAIDLRNGYAELRHHIGHEIECVCYAGASTNQAPQNVALECVDCGLVLIDFDQPELEDCGICGASHPVGFTGDCRDDANRFP